MIRQGSTDYGGYEIQTGGQIYTDDYLVAMGGVHVGGTSNPGTDNLIVDGDVTIGGDLTVSSSGANQKLLTFDQERDWRFYQTGSGAGAGLGLESFYGTEAVGSGTGNKDFTIRTTGDIKLNGKILDKDNKEITGTCRWVSCGDKAWTYGGSCNSYGGTTLSVTNSNCDLSSSTTVAAVAMKYKSCSLSCDGWWFNHNSYYPYQNSWGVDVRVYSYVDISECVQGSYSIYVLAC